MTLRLADPDRRYVAVRLCSDLPLAEEARAFARDGASWVLDLAEPPVARLEYELELMHADGRREIVCDPGNPRRVQWAFGERSLWLAPGYAPPAWLGAEVPPGRVTELAVRGRGLGAEVPVRIWTPDAAPRGPLPWLVVHDGPEYDRLAALTRYCAATITASAVPPFRAALLSAPERDEWYSASGRYARALAVDVLPALGGPGRPIGMGASLGALALLHAHRRAPFAGLFLQSGSFFVPAHDAQESGFARYGRIVRAVRGLQRDAGPPVPVVMTCGAAEENLANNRLMARALARQGFDVELHEVPDLHNHTGWRDAFEPHLTRLLARTR